jgi:hypothetical protein
MSYLGLFQGNERYLGVNGKLIVIGASDEPIEAPPNMLLIPERGSCGVDLEDTEKLIRSIISFSAVEEELIYNYILNYARNNHEWER